MKHKTLWDYLKSHLKGSGTNGFYEVEKPIKAFKSVRHYKEEHQYAAFEYAVASLLIPKGATIFISQVARWRLEQRVLGAYTRRQFVGDCAKIRATHAEVVSIATKREKKLKIASAGRFRAFYYRVGKTVKPDTAFSWAMEACAPGIHFFITLGEAKGYDA